MKLKSSEELAWAYLLKYGVVGKWEYYRGNFEEDQEKTKEMLVDISKNGINLTNSKGPYDDTESEFNGTFAKETLYVQTFYGNVVSNSGKEYRVNMLKEDLTDVFKMFFEFHELGSIEKVVTSRLENYK